MLSLWQTRYRLNIAQRRKCSHCEQKIIGKLLSERKRKFNEDKRDPTVNKSVWNEKRKKWVSPFTQTGYIAPTVQEIFPDLTKETCDSKEFKSATKFVSRCLEKFDNGEFDAEENNTSKKLRLPGCSLGGSQ